MALKDILVIADSSPGSAARVDWACALAVAHGAHLAALHVPARAWFPAFVDVQIPGAVREMQDRLAAEAAERVAAAIRESAAKAGLAVELRTGSGSLDEAAVAQARHADLTVVGQGDPEGGTPMDLLPETLVMGSGRPVLAIPRYGTYPAPAARVLVAWNGTREAARAVNDALPLLARARQVVVLTVNPSDRSPEAVPGADIAVHLARHGVNVEAATTTADDIGVGDLLLSRASDYGVDLLVMGAYGHSRFRETVLGGATRHLLAHMTVPVLMSH